MTGVVKTVSPHWGKLLFVIDGYEVVRYRREVIVYCPCHHGIVARIRQREAARKKSRIQEFCYHCGVGSPWPSIIPILKAQGFKGVSL